MEEYKTEDVETSQNNEEKENSETPDESTEESESEDSKDSQLYARVKKAEQRAKKEEAEKLAFQKEVEKVQKQATGEKPDASDLAKTVIALKDYSAGEIDYIFTQAKALGISPVEATQNEDIQIFLEAKREKQKRSENTPEPSTKQSPSSKPVEQWTPQDVQEASKRGDYQSIAKFMDWAKRN